MSVGLRGGTLTLRVCTMDFGQAMLCLKKGNRICREGWNGKNMWLTWVKPGHYDVGVSTVNPTRSTLKTKLAPWVAIKSANDEFLPWTPSQADMAAEDWDVVPVNEFTEFALIHLDVRTGVNIDLTKFLAEQHPDLSLEHGDTIQSVVVESFTLNGFPVSGDWKDSNAQHSQCTAMHHGSDAGMLHIDINRESWICTFHWSRGKQELPFAVALYIQYGQKG